MIYKISRLLYDTLREANNPFVKTKTKEEVIDVINQQGRFIKKVTALKIKKRGVYI